jgi:MATE family multidrug resistance protein
MTATTADPVAVAGGALARPAGGARVVPGLLVLALKMALAQLAPLLASLYLAGVVARQGSLPFSGYILVASINLTVFLALSTSLQALFYVGGKALGRQRPADYEAAIGAGTRLALWIALPSMLLSAAVGGMLHLLRFDARVVALAAWLGLAAAVGIPPALLMVVYRVHAALNGRAGLVTLLYAAGAALAVALATLAVALAPGHAPVAVVLSLAATNWLVLLGGWLSLRRSPLRLGRGALRASGLGATMRLIAAVGWPIGAVVLLDSLASLASQLIVGRFWLAAVPVHGAVMLWTAVGLVVPIGIGQAAVQSVAVLHARGDRAARNRAAAASLATGALYGAIVAALFAAFPVRLGAVLLGAGAHQPAARALLGQIMGPGGVALGLQGVIVIAAGILRGLGQTRAPLVQALIGYAVIGTGGQLLFGFVLGQGVRGIWLGLILGFATIAAAVTWGCYLHLKPEGKP